jgi:hypothetical protein
MRAVASAVGAASIDIDAGKDLLGLNGTVARDMRHLRWQVAVVVFLMTGLH